MRVRRRASEMRAGRLILRLDDLCRDLTPILAGALPLLVLCGLLLTGGLEVDTKDSRESLVARCDPQRQAEGTAQAPALGPDPLAHLCHGRALEAAADVARERGEA